MGKLAALAWVLGRPAADRIIAGDYTFADWRSEVQVFFMDPVESLRRTAGETEGDEGLR